MKSEYSYIRLILCYLLCLFFLFYSFFGNINIKAKNQPTFTDNFKETIEKDEKKELNSQKEIETTPKEQTQKENNATTPQKTESKPVSAEAVKGKVITRYISPYNAPQGYSGVYLKNSTGVDVDIKKMLEKKSSFKIEKNGLPQVLIMHTHTTETFMEKESDYYTEEFKSRTTDNSKNMAKIGDIIAKKLNSNGIKTLHDTTKHDYPEYTGSYGRAATTINGYLKKYPSIKIVLDLHRDSVSSSDGKTKLVTTINGKKAAQIMLVMGSQTGSIKDFPNWKENLSLAFKLQQTIEAKYPTLARPVMLASKKYNQSLTKGSLLLEFGTEVNTLDEAKYSAELVGDSLVSLLNTLK